MPRSSPVPSPRGGPGGFWQGAALPLTSVGLILKNPRLLGLSLLAAVVSAGVMVVLVITVWPLASGLGTALVGSGSTWRTVAGTALSVLLYLALLVASLLTVPHLVLAPLEDPLSEATELALGGFEVPPFGLGRFLRGALLSATHTVLRLAFLLGGVLVLLPLNLVPVAGSVAYAVASFTWSAWWATAEYLAGPSARHGRGFFAVQRAMREHPSPSLGLGASLVVVLWIPLLNVFLVPLAVVSGTLLFRTLETSGQRGNAQTPPDVPGS